MKTITYNGHVVDRPKLIHKPMIVHTIEPVDKLSYELWSECIRRERMGQKNQDVTLVKKMYL